MVELEDLDIEVLRKEEHPSIIHLWLKITLPDGTTYKERFGFLPGHFADDEEGIPIWHKHVLAWVRKREEIRQTPLSIPEPGHRMKGGQKPAKAK